MTGFMLLGRSFEIEADDASQTCVYKALSVLREGEGVTSQMLYDALADCRYSKATLQAVLSYNRSFKKKRVIDPATRLRIWHWYINRALPFVPGKARTGTKKQRIPRMTP